MCLPGRRWRILPIEHAIFHTVFDIDEMPQIPARDFAGYGTTEPAYIHRFPQGSLETPTIRAYMDDDGRLMAIATHNTDIADGWNAKSYGEWYFEEFSTKSISARHQHRDLCAQPLAQPGSRWPRPVAAGGR